MFDSKKVKKLHRFKLYQMCKNNGKVCLYNKYSYYISQIILGRLYFNQDFVNNYKFLIRINNYLLLMSFVNSTGGTILPSL